MAKMMNEISSKLNKGLNQLLTLPNTILWGVLPGAIAGILILIIIIFSKVPITGESEIELCYKKNEAGYCKKNIISNRFNILLYTLVPLICGVLIGGFIFKLKIRNTSTIMVES